MSDSPEWFTAVSAGSLAFVSAMGVAAWVSANAFLPKHATKWDRFTWIWMVRYPFVQSVELLNELIQAFDGLIHFSFEAIFLYYSLFGRTIATSPGILPEMGMSQPLGLSLT